MTTPAEPTTDAAASPTERPFQFRLVHLLVALTVVGCVLGMIVGVPRAIHHARIAARESFCQDNIRILAVAISNYHDEWGSFPPAKYVDDSGKPMHSWRVLITPHMEGRDFFERYDLNEPWNGPNNSMLAGWNWKRIRCPCEEFSEQTPHPTNYVAIVGPGTMWPGARATSISNLTDGTSNTLMIVEIAHSDIHWMEPRDLPVEELAAWLDPNHRPQLLGNHIEGGLVAYADGHVELLPRDVTIERLKALVTPAGNDVKAGMEVPGR